MKITLRNWGPVESFQYDFTKSLIITYGDNNIGKSYAMQAVYLFLKYLIPFAEKAARYPYRYYLYLDDANGKQSSIQEMVMEFSRDEKNDTKDISRRLEQIFAERMAGELFPRLLEAIANTFGTCENMLLENPEIRLELGNEMECTLYFGSKSIDFTTKRKPVRLRRAASEFHKSRNGKSQLDIYVCGTHVNAPIQLVEEELWKMRREFSVALLSRVRSVYFLPASRSGIYTGMNSFGPILAQISQNRAYIRGTIQIPSIPEPISDYYMQLSEIKGAGRGPLETCAEEIEANVLNGEVIYDTKKKTIAYRPFDLELQLEMNDASSMVSEISPVIAFLKYIVGREPGGGRRRYLEANAKPGFFIFIEEPEAHLHPKNQVALIRALAGLAKQNVILVMASHSNYIFNQLNNMVLKRTLDQNSYSPILLKKEGEKSRSVYMEMDELGVNDENFADISGALLDEREAIIERLIQESNSINDTDDSEGKQAESVSSS